MTGSKTNSVDRQSPDNDVEEEERREGKKRSFMDIRRREGGI